MLAINNNISTIIPIYYNIPSKTFHIIVAHTLIYYNIIIL